MRSCWASRYSGASDGKRRETLSRRRAGCRVGWWRPDADEPWLLVTNHPSVTVEEYGLRMGGELAFRDFKSGGWQWQRSRVRVPERAARLWLVLVLAYAWMVVFGLWALAGQAWRRGVVRGSARRGSVFQVGLRVYRCWVLRGRWALGDG